MFDLFAKVGAEAWQRLASPILVKFMIVGACGCVVNSVVLSITYGLAHIALPVAVIVSSEVAIVANYLLNDSWTFRGVGVSWTRFAKFNFVACLGLAQAALSVWLLVEYLKVEYLLANLLGLGFSGAVNFGLSATWIWRQAAPQPPVEAVRRDRQTALRVPREHCRVGTGPRSRTGLALDSLTDARGAGNLASKMSTGNQFSRWTDRKPPGWRTPEFLVAISPARVSKVT